MCNLQENESSFNKVHKSNLARLYWTGLVEFRSIWCQMETHYTKIFNLVWHSSWCAMSIRVVSNACHAAPSDMWHLLWFSSSDCKTISVGLMKGWLKPKAFTQIPHVFQGLPPKAGIILRWVTILGLDFQCNLPPVIHPIVVEVSRWS